MSGSIVFCPTCSNVPAGISVQIVAVVPALNATVLLRPGSDGLYRGNVLFDSAKLTVLDFYFEVGDQRTPTFTLQLTQDQIASGVALVTNAEPPVFSGAITACSDLTRRVRVYCVDVRLTETGEGAAQQVEITTINFETLEGTGSVTLARRPATNLPINLGNFADSNSRQVAVELNVPASVERFQMTVSGIAQDAIDRTSIFEFSQALNRDDLGSGISRQPAR